MWGLHPIIQNTLVLKRDIYNDIEHAIREESSKDLNPLHQLGYCQHATCFHYQSLRLGLAGRVKSLVTGKILIED
jgi:hypothetical protein